MKFAGRMESIAPSGTVKIGDRVAELREEGVEVIPFSMGEPDFGTPQHVIDATIKAMNDGFTHYTSSAGILPLREAVAHKTRTENGIECSASNVIITPAKFGIFMSILATIEKGDEIIIPDPSWVSYYQAIRFAGGKPVPVDTTETHYRLHPDKVAEAITPKTRMIILNSPGNPTGSVATLDELRGIADIAKDHDLIVASDEIYEKLIFDEKHHSIGSLDGMFERTITVNGFSKSYAMTGWRIGWLVANDDLIKEILKIQQHTLTCVTSFVQYGGLEALRGPQDSIPRMVEIFRQRRDLIMEFLEDIPTLSAEKPEGAFYVFAKYDHDMSSMDMAEYLLNTAHVAMTPGIAFGPHGEGHLRISYTTHRQNIETGMLAIKEALEKLD